MEEIKTQLESIKKDLDGAINAGVEASKEYTQEKLNAFNEVLEKSNSSIANLESRVKELKANGMEDKDAVAKTTQEALMNAMDCDGFKSFVKGEAPRFNIEDLKVKTAGDMTTPSGVVDNTYLPILPEVERKFRVRNALRQGSMGGNAIQFPDVAAKDGVPTVVAEGGAKTQMDKTISLVTYPAQTIAGYMRLSNQMLSDFQGITSYLAYELPRQIYNTEDTQLLTGDGSSPNLYGLSSGALSDANLAGTAFENAIANGKSTRWDCLLAAIGLLKSSDYAPDAILMNPQDVITLAYTRDDNNQYIAPVIFVDNVPTIYGLPIQESSAVAVGSFFVMDSQNVGQLFQREGVSVRFFEQDASNVTTNETTVRGEMREAFAKFHSDACFTDTFANVTTVIEASA
jgi:HK97 family phage major capsid protein